MTRRATRTRRNLARAVGLALVAVAVVLLGTSSSAGADGSGATLAAKGWWWQAQQLPAGTIPAPPNVQPGQLNVQGAPSDSKGAAFAAVRFAVDANHTVQSLTLTVAPNGDSGAPAALVACRTGSAWSPADAGPWSAAPQVDTKACVNGNKSSDGKSYSFGVAPLQTGTLLDIAIVPGVDPTTKAPATFSLVFDAPSNDALTTVGGTPPTVTTSPVNLGSEGSTAVAGTGSVTPIASVPAVTTGLPAEKVGDTATAPSKQVASQPGLDAALASSNSSERDKRVGYVVLAIAAAVGLYAWRQDNLMAMTAALGGREEPGGLGRFTRPRQGQPPALT